MGETGDAIDHFAKVTSIGRENALECLGEADIDPQTFSDTYQHLLEVVDSRCINCPVLPRRVLAALETGRVDEVLEETHLTNENRSCVYGARLLFDEDVTATFQCTDEEWQTEWGRDPFGDPGNFN